MNKLQKFKGYKGKFEKSVGTEERVFVNEYKIHFPQGTGALIMTHFCAQFFLLEVLT